MPTEHEREAVVQDNAHQGLSALMIAAAVSQDLPENKAPGDSGAHGSGGATVLTLRGMCTPGTWVGGTALSGRDPLDVCHAQIIRMGSGWMTMRSRYMWRSFMSALARTTESLWQRGALWSLIQPPWRLAWPQHLRVCGGFA